MYSIYLQNVNLFIFEMATNVPPLCRGFEYSRSFSMVSLCYHHHSFSKLLPTYTLSSNMHNSPHGHLHICVACLLTHKMKSSDLSVNNLSESGHYPEHCNNIFPLFVAPR